MVSTFQADASCHPVGELFVLTHVDEYGVTYTVYGDGNQQPIYFGSKDEAIEYAEDNQPVVSA